MQLRLSRTAQKREADLLATTARAIATADHFTTTLWHDRRYHSVDHPTLEAARAFIPGMMAQFPDSYRRPMIYAVLNGRAELIPDRFQGGMNAPSL